MTYKERKEQAMQILFETSEADYDEIERLAKLIAMEV